MQAGVGRGTTERIDAFAALRYLTKAFNQEAPSGPLEEELRLSPCPGLYSAEAPKYRYDTRYIFNVPVHTEMDLVAWVIILPPVKKTLCPCPISSCSDLVWLHL